MAIIAHLKPKRKPIDTGNFDFFMDDEIEASRILNWNEIPLTNSRIKKEEKKN